MTLLSKLNLKTKAILTIFISTIAITSLFGVFIYLSLRNFVYDDFFKTLKIRTNVIAKANIDGAYNDTSFVAGYQSVIEEVAEKLIHERDYILELSQLNTKNERHIADSLGVPVSFLTIIRQSKEANYQKGHYLYKGILYSFQGKDYIVIASAESHFNQKLISHLQRISFIAILVAVAIGILSAYYISKTIFKPISEVTDMAKRISSENLHLRLDDTHYSQELKELVKTFNDMLSRIETSFETQNNFISNASHELRTPLTSIMGTADVTLSRLRTPGEYIETLQIILHETEKLDNKTKALLFLAQTGFNGKAQKFERMRIDQLIWDCIDTIEKLNPEGKVNFDTSLLPENSTRLKIIGNEQLLHLAFTNIISNACKYSDNQVVTVSIGSSDRKVVIVVRDQGIGIPEHELAYIYDPFFRASNTKNYDGYGIGLPLARNIVRLHSGKILVTAQENKGTTVSIELPLAVIND